MPQVFKFRSRKGKLYKVENASFVEVCDDKDSLALLIRADPEDGKVFIYYPYDEEFKQYCKYYKVKASSYRKWENK